MGLDRDTLDLQQTQAAAARACTLLKTLGNPDQTLKFGLRARICRDQRHTNTQLGWNAAAFLSLYRLSSHKGRFILEFFECSAINLLMLIAGIFISGGT